MNKMIERALEVYQSYAGTDEYSHEQKLEGMRLAIKSLHNTSDIDNAYQYQSLTTFKTIVECITRPKKPDLYKLVVLYDDGQSTAVAIRTLDEALRDWKLPTSRALYKAVLKYPEGNLNNPSIIEQWSKHI